MIRALTRRNGRTLLVLGLEGENIRRLRAGDPIFLDGTAHGMGCPIDVFIAAGETAADIVRALEAHGFDPPISADAAAAAKPTPDHPVVIDLRGKPRGGDPS